MDVDYDEYINSMAWKIKRNRMIVEASWTCQKCGATNTALEVHHLTYDNLGNEEPEDLMVLCKKCHAELTEKADRKKRGGRAGYWATLNKWALKKCGSTEQWALDLVKPELDAWLGFRSRY